MSLIRVAMITLDFDSDHAWLVKDLETRWLSKNSYISIQSCTSVLLSFFRTRGRKAILLYHLPMVNLLLSVRASGIAQKR